MKCLDTEKLIRYAYHLSDEAAASEVRAHLGECLRCREIVEQHGRLDALLDEWKVAEPTPGFDARVRQAVRAQEARHATWGFGSLGWARGLAVALLGVLIVAGTVWIIREHHRTSNSGPVATRQHQPPMGPQASTSAAKLLSPTGAPPAGARPAHAASELGTTSGVAKDDQDALALEDYDVAANFDLLSELPKAEQRVVN